MNYEKAKRIAAAVLSVVMVLTIVSFPTTPAFAETNSKAAVQEANMDNPDDPSDPSNPEEPDDPSDPSNPEEPDDPSDPSNPEEPADTKLHIVKFAELPSNIARQTIKIGQRSKIKLPEKVSVVLDDGKTVKVPVKWTVPQNAGKSKGTEIITCSITDENYVIDEGTEPVIRVTTEKKTTIVYDLKMSRSKKSRGKITDTIWIKNGSSNVKLQMRVKGKWVTKKRARIKKYSGLSKNGNKKVRIYFPEDWWTKETTYWRIVIPSTEETTGYKSSRIKVRTKRYYQNPSRYYKIKDKVKLSCDGGYTLYRGCMGYKTYKVNKFFGYSNITWPRYSSYTESKVRRFQKKHHLKVTGHVNKKTWLKMGFSEKSWYSYGAYLPRVKTDLSSTRSDCVDAMVSTARSYVGKPYIVGASVKQGCDCSGLIMQCLYSAGINPEPIGVLRHYKPAYEYESRNLARTSKLKTVSYSNRKKGDLLFFGNGGVVNHVGIYIGGGKMIDAMPPRVRVASVWSGGHLMKVRRVFN